MTLSGKPLVVRNTADGYRHGIGMVSQHYSIIPELSCLENLMLGDEPGVVIGWNDAEARAKELGARLGVELDWKAPARELSPASAQKLEILKLLWRRAEVMILDEPTAMLSPDDANALYANLKQLAQEGATVLVVTHRLPEVMDHCEAITVLRGGEKVADRQISETSTQELAELIVGRALGEVPPPRPKPDSEILLKAQGLTILGDRGNEAVKGVDLELRRGELVGLAGVDGNGQRELFQALLGVRPNAGRLEFLGQDLAGKNVRERLKMGLRLIAEDRHEEAVVEDWTLLENSALGHQMQPEMRKGSGLDQGAIQTLTTRLIERFQARTGGPKSLMGSLSGGNQQKVVAARAMEFGPHLILAFQPTRGLDIGAMQGVYAAIRDACEKGAAALVVSFDLDELIEQCDRVWVMNHGRLSVPDAAGERDRTILGGLMVAS